MLLFYDLSNKNLENFNRKFGKSWEPSRKFVHLLGRLRPWVPFFRARRYYRGAPIIPTGAGEPLPPMVGDLQRNFPNFKGNQ